MNRRGRKFWLSQLEKIDYISRRGIFVLYFLDCVVLLKFIRSQILQNLFNFEICANGNTLEHTANACGPRADQFEALLITRETSHVFNLTNVYALTIYSISQWCAISNVTTSQVLLDWQRFQSYIAKGSQFHYIIRYRFSFKSSFRF